MRQRERGGEEAGFAVRDRHEGERMGGGDRPRGGTPPSNESWG